MTANIIHLPHATQPSVLQTETTPPPFTETAISQAISGETQAAVTKVRRCGRQSKLTRGLNTFRPGQNPTGIQPAVPVKEKLLVFIVPSNHPHGSVEEFSSVSGIVTQIGTLPQLGEVASITIRDRSWKITLTLAVHEDMDDDEMLSETFRSLMPLIEASPELRNGFRVGSSSRWEFRVNNFVADEGGF